MKPFIYMGYGINKLIFGITGTEEPKILIKSLKETFEEMSPFFSFLYEKSGQKDRKIIIATVPKFFDSVP